MPNGATVVVLSAESWPGRTMKTILVDVAEFGDDGDPNDYFGELPGEYRFAKVVGQVEIIGDADVLNSLEAVFVGRPGR